MDDFGVFLVQLGIFIGLFIIGYTLRMTAFNRLSEVEKQNVYGSLANPLYAKMSVGIWFILWMIPLFILKELEARSLKILFFSSLIVAIVLPLALAVRALRQQKLSAAFYKYYFLGTGFLCLGLTCFLVWVITKVDW